MVLDTTPNSSPNLSPYLITRRYAIYLIWGEPQQIGIVQCVMCLFCERLAIIDDWWRRRKIVLSNRPLCKRPANPEDPDHLQKMFICNCLLYITDHPIQIPNREWGKGHFHLLIGPFPHSRFGHFQCPKRKSKTTFQQKYTPNKWEIWPQKPLLTTGKSFFSWGKVRKALTF